MTLSERLTHLREANPSNTYFMDPKTRSIYLLVPKPGNTEPNQFFHIMPATYTAICVHTESEEITY